MDKSQITSLALKIAGIYILATAISTIPSLVMLLKSGDDLSFSGSAVVWAKGFTLIPVLLLVLVGFSLLAFNRSITWFLVRPEENNETTPPPLTDEHRQIKHMVFVLLGIYLLVRSAPDLIGGFLGFVIADDRSKIPLEKAELIGDALVCVLGVAVIRSRGAWTDLVERLAATRPMKNESLPDGDDER